MLVKGDPDMECLTWVHWMACLLLTSCMKYRVTTIRVIMILYCVQIKPYLWCTICGYNNHINTWRPRQYRRHFADDIFEWILLNGNFHFRLKFPLSLFAFSHHWSRWWFEAERTTSQCLNQWRLSLLPTYLCVTRFQWVNTFRPSDVYMRR